MRKILIVDDERMVRLGLISMIQELYPGQYEISEAINGDDALQKSQLLYPDIIFLDIRMPVKDGLTALPELYEITPDSKVLLLTGFAEFEYARTAMRYGINEYLLKPCSLEDIKKAIDTIEQSFQEKHNNLNNHFSVVLSQALNLYFSKEIFPEDTVFSNTRFSAALLYIDLPNKSAAGRYCEEIIELYTTIASNKCLEHSVYFLPTGELCLFMANDTKQSLVNFMQSLFTEKYAGTSAVIFESEYLTDLLQKITIMQNQNSLRCFFSGHWVLFKQLSSLRNSTEICAFSDHLENLLVSYVVNDATGFYENKQFLLYTNELYKSFPFERKKSCFRFVTNFIGLSAKSSDFKDVYSLISIFPNSKSSKLDSDDLINRIKNYISQHYNEDLSIQTLGEIFDISPNYFSKIFHERTGTRYIDYITNYRIDIAKKLLRSNQELTIQQVSDSIGYYSTRHFVKTFKKVTGSLPSEYKL